MQTNTKTVRKTADEKLPAIPDKIYFSIGEVAKLCNVKPHVLRYWEQEFKALSPSKRRNRRYYLRNDVLLVRKIKKLLYAQGFTIEGARQQLNNETNTSAVSHVEFDSLKATLQDAISELENLLDKKENGDI